MTTTQAKTVVDRLVAAMRDADWAAIVATYAPDVLLDTNLPAWRFQLQGSDAATQYFQRGYPLAQQSGDETLVGEYEDQMRACGMLGPAPEATEEATEEPDADANA